MDSPQDWGALPEEKPPNPESWGAISEAQGQGLPVAIPPTGYVPYEKAQGYASGALVDPILGTAQTIGALTGIPTPEINKRETELAKEGPDFQTGRELGNLTSPANLLPGGIMGRGATAVGRVGRAMVGGAAGAAMQPTESGDLSSKAEQTGMGLTLGFILGTAGEGASAAAQSLGKYLARNKPEVVMDQAIQAILHRISQDTKAGGPTAVQAMELVNAANKAGKPMTLMDVTGKNVEGLAGRVSRQPGPSKGMFEDFLTQRDKGAADRLSADVAKAVHGGPTMHETAEALLAARSAAGRPAYAAMERLEGIWSPRLQEFLDDPALKRGMGRGYEIERLQALADGRKFDPTQLGVDLDAEGNLKLLKVPNMRVLDLGKQGLDAMIADERNDLTGRLTNRGVALEKVRQAYVSLLDELDTSGMYKAARAAWAGPSKSLDALRQGHAVFTGTPEETAAEFAKLSDSDKEFYRIGVADKLREKIDKVGLGGDEAKALLKNSWTRKHLRPVMRSDEDYEKFVGAVSQETEMFEKTRRVLRGSQTAERVAEDTSRDSMMKSAGMYAAEKMIPGFKKAKGVYDVVRDLGVKQSPEVNEKMAKILLTTEFDDAAEITQRLRGEIASPKDFGKRSSEAFLRGAGLMAPGVGGLVGGMVGR